MFLNIDQIEKTIIAAIDDEGRHIRYGELADMIRAFPAAIPKRSIVFLLCKNTIGALVSYLSMVNSDIVPVMLSESIDSGLLDRLMQVYRPQFICAEEEKGAGYGERVTPEQFGFCFFKTTFEPYRIHDDLELLMTTSGSTGSPKLVRYKRGNLEANARNVARAWEWTDSERPICDLQMNYTMGLNVINTHLYVGATLLMVTHNITDAGYWKFIKENRATNFTGVPFSYDLLWKLRFPRMDLPFLTTLSEGGGKLSEQMFERVAEFAAQNNKRFIASFGTTETAARMAMLDPQMALSKAGSIGKAIPEGELLLLDENGEPILSPAAEGELAYRGPNVTMGYAVSADDLKLGDVFEGLYKTGDIARRDADGFYYIVGRKSRFLKMLGYRVSLDQCEQLVKEQFEIDCACGGTDSQLRVYVPGAGNKDAIRSFLSSKTGIYSSMFKVISVDHIPRNATGKVLYKELDALCD